MGEAEIRVRPAQAADFDAIARIYNEGIEDRIATLETDAKDPAALREAFSQRAPRYACVVAERGGQILGWASLNPYSHRCAYDAVADLSIYVRRDARGTGVGSRLLEDLERRAREVAFHKIVLFTLPFNEAGQRLYRKRGFRVVGVFREQGRLDGRRIDVMAMEKLLS
jgi:L-amino acid N-acyltransferase YncA